MFFLCRIFVVAPKRMGNTELVDQTLVIEHSVVTLA